MCNTSVSTLRIHDQKTGALIAPHLRVINQDNNVLYKFFISTTGRSAVHVKVEETVVRRLKIIDKIHYDRVLIDPSRPRVLLTLPTSVDYTEISRISVTTVDSGTQTLSTYFYFIRIREYN